MQLFLLGLDYIKIDFDDPSFFTAPDNVPVAAGSDTNIQAETDSEERELTPLMLELIQQVEEGESLSAVSVDSSGNAFFSFSDDSQDGTYTPPSGNLDGSTLQQRAVANPGEGSRPAHVNNLATRPRIKMNKLLTVIVVLGIIRFLNDILE